MTQHSRILPADQPLPARIVLADEPPIRIGNLVADPPARSVIGPDGVSERLEPRVMQVLLRLAQTRRVITRDDLVESCWDGRIVGDDAINRVISRLRRLAVERGAGFSIETIARVGYRLHGEVAPVLAPAPAGPGPRPLDLLRGEDRRSRRRWAWIALGAAVVALLFAALALELLKARAEARARRADAEGLVEFMLGDLRKRLDAVGRLDVLDSVGAETMRYYGRQPLGSLDADSLSRRARAVRLVGEVAQQRGDYPTATAAFREASLTTGELMRRAPTDGKRVYDHMQSVFALGEVARPQGDLKTVAAASEDYARLADRLIAIDPRRDDWLSEWASSRHNRASIAYRHREAEAAIVDFSRAATVFSTLRRKQPRNADFAEYFAQSEAYLADTYDMNGQPLEALAARQTEAAVYEQAIASDRNNMEAVQDLAWANYAQANLYREMGQLSRSLALLRVAKSMIDQRLRIDPTNVETLSRATEIYGALAFALSEHGESAASADALSTAKHFADQLSARDSKVMLWRGLSAEINLIRAETAFYSGNRDMANWLAMAVLDNLRPTRAEPPSSRSSLLNARAHVLLARLSPSTAAVHWRKIVEALSPLRAHLSVGERCALSLASQQLGLAAVLPAVGEKDRSVVVDACKIRPWTAT